MAAGRTEGGPGMSVFNQLGNATAMKRRQFLVVSALAAAMPGTVLADGEQVEYSRAAFDALRQSGKPVLLDFYTTW